MTTTLVTGFIDLGAREPRPPGKALDDYVRHARWLFAAAAPMVVFAEPHVLGAAGAPEDGSLRSGRQADTRRTGRPVGSRGLDAGLADLSAATVCAGALRACAIEAVPADAFSRREVYYGRPRWPVAGGVLAGGADDIAWFAEASPRDRRVPGRGSHERWVRASPSCVPLRDPVAPISPVRSMQRGAFERDCREEGEARLAFAESAPGCCAVGPRWGSPALRQWLFRPSPNRPDLAPGGVPFRRRKPVPRAASTSTATRCKLGHPECSGAAFHRPCNSAYSRPRIARTTLRRPSIRCSRRPARTGSG
ncbi:MAG: hypothetical protein IPO58_23330 [Betaproteobacteria bacterium]|nr:hypothetical protein [Betaproteobacteria bacterium]